MRGSWLTCVAGLVLLASTAAAGTLGPGDNFRPKKYNMRPGKKAMRHKINVDEYLAAPSNHYESAPVTFLKPPPGARQPVDRRQRSPYQHQQKPATNNPTRQSRCKF